ncbi:MAG: hypothetical protein C4B56_04545 [Candidatus Methanophagaceae archaeon]|nr:MAG: hypothetical protein C4B56_04545 [Methanophagales archaeon]
MQRLLTTTLNENKIKNWGFAPLYFLMSNDGNRGKKNGKRKTRAERKRKMPLNKKNRGANPRRGGSMLEKS